MGPDFKLETEHLQDMFHNASLNVFPTCEDIRCGEFAEYEGVAIVESVSRILSLYKDLPEIKERTNEILLYLDLDHPNLSVEISKHYRVGRKKHEEFMDSETRAEIIKTFDEYFKSVNGSVLPAVTSLYNRLVYMKKILATKPENDILDPEIYSRMTNVVHFLCWKVYPDVHFWKQRVKCGNSCKTEEDKMRLLEWLWD